jgi:hypothetical protein
MAGLFSGEFRTALPAGGEKSGGMKAELAAAPIECGPTRFNPDKTRASSAVGASRI